MSPRAWRWAAAGLALAILPLAARAAPAGDFTYALTGDLIYVRPALPVIERQAPGIVAVLRKADVAFGNFESNAFTLTAFDGAMQAEIEGPALITPPPVLKELKSLGFDLMSHANNHAGDWGPAGIRATHRAFVGSGVAIAGTGPSLAAARAPGFVDARRIRVGLVSATSTFPRAAMASHGFGQVKSRPGVNGLQLQRVVLVPPGDLAALKSVAAHAETVGATIPPPLAADETRLAGQTFKADPSLAATVGYAYRMDETDRKRLLAGVAEARAQSPLVIFSLHTHEPGPTETAPPDFEVALAHQAIDAGADVFVAHGPHRLRGVEIYKGRPIFYSLGNFVIMQPNADANPQPLVIPPGSLFTQRAWLEGVVAEGRYVGGRLTEIRLHPYEMSATNVAATHGLPQAVAPEAARAIIQKLQDYSQPFGTRIALENGVGIIRLNQ